MQSSLALLDGKFLPPLLLPLLEVALCRQRFWFWDSIVLWQTFFVALALVFATSLNAIFQLTIMLTILSLGFALLTILHPFESELSQGMQVPSYRQ